jgi:hypothetical protein
MKRQTINGIAVVLEGAEGLLSVSRELPKLNVAIVSSRCQKLSAGGEGKSVDQIAVAAELEGIHCAFEWMKVNGAVFPSFAPSDRQPTPLGFEAYGGDSATDAIRPFDKGAFRAIEEEKFIPTGYGDEGVVWVIGYRRDCWCCRRTNTGPRYPYQDQD